ncbi:MAG: hypothetical protein H6579_00840 [Chitinophagales bacterium]|nr:hypothetical protein [Chitinophagales bacterium]
MRRFKALLLLISCLKLSLHAQSIGDWRMHINYSNASEAALAPDRIMVANEKSVLEYSFSDNSLRSFDKAKGLSDHGISAISYDALSATFIIAYANSNVDLIKGNTIINIPDIKNKLSAGSKKINSILGFEGKAYISTDFGIVVLDIANEEIDNTYIIGSTGDPSIVLDCAIAQDSIYALTDEGLKRAALSSDNLLDYTEWTHDLFVNALTEVESFNDTLYAIGPGFYRRNGQAWDTLMNANPGELKKLRASEDLCMVQSNLYVLSLNEGLDSLSTNFLIDPQFAFLQGGNYFYGDLKKGLYQNNQQISSNNHPYTNKGFNAVGFGTSIAISSGGFDKNLDGNQNVEGGFYVYQGDNWTNHNIYSTIGTSKPSEDPNRIAYNEVDGKLYIACFEGLIEYDFSTVKIYNQDNSPIDPVLGQSKLTGVAIDSEGNVWVINPQSTAALLVKKREDNTWAEFVLQNDNAKFNRLFIDNVDQKWIALRDQGITLFKEGDNLGQSGSQKLVLSSSSGQGNLPNNNVNCITQDKDGQIWVGTDEGIAVFSCPENIFDASTSCRISDRITNTLDEYTEYLFETDAVKAIEVDGANRKWIGTSAGVWLLSADGKTEIHSFNKENSPLPSNEINDIKINKATGEVFILTDQGIVSYFSDATEGASNHDEIKAYPNPVRPEYQGFISITGLVENAFVKITDAHGVLINEGYALGGKYVWDGRDYNGKRASTGVYYIFSSDSEAKEKAVTKIAFVN